MDVMQRRRELIKQFNEKYIDYDYIVSTGTQYIDTEYTPVHGDEFDLYYSMDSRTTNFNTLFSAGTGTYQTIVLGGNNLAPNQFYCKYFASGNAPLLYFNGNMYDWKRIKIDYNGNFYADNNVNPVGNSSYEAELDGTNTTLFLMRRRNGNSPWYGKVGRFTIKNNGVKKLDLIPCKRISDEAIGMRDTVSNKFFTNVGTGNFRCGNN